MSNNKKMPENIYAWSPYEGCGHGYFLDTPQDGRRSLYAKYIRSDLCGLKCFYEDDLPNKFIAIYSDGSGCDIFYEDGEGSDFYIGCGRGVNGVQKDWFSDAGYLWFLPLPDDFDVWRAEE